ncbi:hypothetical protein MMIN_15390 [Mycolicibacter minnesotensis]|nr:hypothetical protein MMIN_15390 [Mycolicibacter minnesotensis]
MATHPAIATRTCRAIATVRCKVAATRGAAGTTGTGIAASPTVAAVAAIHRRRGPGNTGRTVDARGTRAAITADTARAMRAGYRASAADTAVATDTTVTPGHTAAGTLGDRVVPGTTGSTTATIAAVTGDGARNAIGLHATKTTVTASTTITASSAVGGQRGAIDAGKALPAGTAVAAATGDATGAAGGLPAGTLTANTAKSGISTRTTGLTSESIDMQGRAIVAVGAIMAVTTNATVATGRTDTLVSCGARSSRTGEPAAGPAGTGLAGRSTVATGTTVAATDRIDAARRAVRSVCAVAAGTTSGTGTTRATLTTGAEEQVRTPTTGAAIAPGAATLTGLTVGTRQNTGQARDPC